MQSKNVNEATIYKKLQTHAVFARRRDNDSQGLISHLTVY